MRSKRQGLSSTPIWYASCHLHLKIVEHSYLTNEFKAADLRWKFRWWHVCPNHVKKLNDIKAINYTWTPEVARSRLMLPPLWHILVPLVVSTIIWLHTCHIHSSLTKLRVVLPYRPFRVQSVVRISNNNIIKEMTSLCVKLGSSLGVIFLLGRNPKDVIFKGPI